MLSQTATATAQPLHIDTVKRHLVIDHNDDDLLFSGLIDSATQWVEDHTQRAIVQQEWQQTLNQFFIKQQLNRVPVLAVDSIKYLDSAAVEKTLDATVYRVNLESGGLSLQYGQCWPQALPVDDSISIAFQAGYLIPLAINDAADTLTATGIGFANDQVLFLSSNHTLPAGLSEKTPYYVINSTGNSFQVSLTQGGAAIDIANIGTGDCFVGELNKAIQHAMLLLIGHWYNNRENAIVGNAPHEIPLGVEPLLNNYRVISL